MEPPILYFCISILKMKAQIIYLLRQVVFWLLVFMVNRIIFLVYYSYLLNADGIGFYEILSVFYHAIKLDISTISYILVFPFLLNLFSNKRNVDVLNKLNRIYSLLVLIIYELISLGELQLYGEWKTKLSAKALIYLRQPNEILSSATNLGIVVSIVLFVALVFGFYFLFKRYVSKTKPEALNIKKSIVIAYILVVPVVLFAGMRGGFQAIPITASQSYFSNHDILNITAVNPAYNMIFSIIDYQQIKSQNIFKTLDDKHALEIVKNIHEVEKDTTVSIINTLRPNIVIILLESWSADMIESLGGNAGFTPEFRELEKEGLLFTEFYATANRSQQAIASLFSGLPGLPVTALTDHPEKYPSVPSLVKIMNGEGYFTSFTFGGKLIYGNMKSYLLDNKFDLIVEQDDLESKYGAGKLGVHDEFVFEYFEEQISKQEQPFFSSLFTLSSHSPYDFPGERHFKKLGMEEDFANSVFYTDRELAKFFQKAKKQEYWKNTLFVIMADHSHNTYKNHPVHSFEYHKIPLLITGGALGEEFRGKQNNKLCSNVDVTKTLLKQLGMNADDFFWSKDILNPYSPEFAYFELNDGFGWKRPYGEQVLRIKGNYYFKQNVSAEKKEEFDLEGRSYLQTWFSEFMSY